MLPYLDIEPGPDVARNGGSEHTKVLIADPFQLFRQALRVCLNENGRLQVVQEVRSPKDLRQAQHRVEYDLVLIASDFLIGSRSPVAKRLNEELLTLEEARGEQNNPAIVLVADEDFGALPYKAEWNNSESCLFIDKGATIEALLDAISRLESA